jgi:hypothetical protein
MVTGLPGCLRDARKDSYHADDSYDSDQDERQEKFDSCELIFPVRISRIRHWADFTLTHVTGYFSDAQTGGIGH